MPLPVAPHVDGAERKERDMVAQGKAAKVVAHIVLVDDSIDSVWMTSSAALKRSDDIEAALPKVKVQIVSRVVRDYFA